MAKESDGEVVEREKEGARLGEELAGDISAKKRCGEREGLTSFSGSMPTYLSTSVQTCCARSFDTIATTTVAGCAGSLSITF